MDDKKKLAAIACFGVALILGIAAAASPSIMTFEMGESTAGYGIFEKESCPGGTCTTSDEECNSADATGAKDCASGVDSKCKAGKAFIILGILSTTAAAGLVVSGAGPAIAGAAAGGFASFSYMIVFSLYASTMNASAEDCGFGDNEFVSYGAAFFLTIIAFLLSAIGAAAAFTAGGAE